MEREGTAMVYRTPYRARRYWRVSSRDWDWTRMVALARVIGQLSVALVFAPVLVALLGLALLLGLLPISQIRTAILAAQSTLTATVGDGFAFVESPLGRHSFGHAFSMAWNSSSHAASFG